jgi:hypothetical protein
MVKVYTVEPILRDSPLWPEKVVYQDRWSNFLDVYLLGKCKSYEKSYLSRQVIAIGVVSKTRVHCTMKLTHNSMNVYEPNTCFRLYGAILGPFEACIQPNIYLDSGYSA